MAAWADANAGRFARSVHDSTRATFGKVKQEGKEDVRSRLGGRAMNTFTGEFFPNKGYNAAFHTYSRWLRTSGGGKVVKSAGLNAQVVDILYLYAVGGKILPYRADKLFLPAETAPKDVVDKRLRPKYLARLRAEGRLSFIRRGNKIHYFERRPNAAPGENGTYLGTSQPEVTRFPVLGILKVIEGPRVARLFEAEFFKKFGGRA